MSMRQYEIIESGLYNKVLVKWTSESNKDFLEFSVHTLDLNNDLIWGHYFNRYLDASMYFNQYRCKFEDLIEFCSECNEESIVKNDFKLQRCSHCGRLINPCNMCEMDYVNCGSDCSLNQIKKYELQTSNDSFKVTEEEIKYYFGVSAEEFMDSYTYDDAEYLADRLGVEIDR